MAEIIINENEKKKLLTLEEIINKQLIDCLVRINIFKNENHYISNFGAAPEPFFDMHVALDIFKDEVIKTFKDVMELDENTELSVSTFNNNVFIDYLNTTTDTRYGYMIDCNLKNKIFIMLPLTEELFDKKIMDYVCTQPIDYLQYNVEVDEFFYNSRAVEINEDVKPSMYNKVLKYFN